jgi:hypothetical protein
LEAAESKEAAEEERMKSKAVIDRIEDGGMVVLYSNDVQLNPMSVALFPDGVGGGDHVQIEILVDVAAREESEGRIEKLKEELEG